MEASVPSLQAGLHPSTRANEGDVTYAAIDLGTNNCRLLIARPNGRGFRIVDAFSRIVRLGEGLAGSGSLSEEAMARAIDALKVCAHKIRRRAVTHVRAVATEACRRAANCPAFLDRVRAETGLEIEIISSAEEAVLAFKGCSPLLSVRRPRAVVFDIGGGSTELGWLRLRSGRPPQILDTLSIPFGVVNLTERYGGSRIAPELYGAMVDEVAGQPAPLRRGQRHQPARRRRRRPDARHLRHRHDPGRRASRPARATTARSSTAAIWNSRPSAPSASSWPP